MKNFEKAIDALDHAGYTIERNLTDGISFEKLGKIERTNST